MLLSSPVNTYLPQIITENYHSKKLIQFKSTIGLEDLKVKKSFYIFPPTHFIFFFHFIPLKAPNDVY